MPETDQAETNANPVGGESRLIAEAHAAVLEQTKKNEFDAAPYERATELLESLPPAKFVDGRVQLALDITLATRTEYRPDLSRRALYAAFPSSGEIKDRRLKRKWFTFMGIMEAAFGNTDRSFRCKLIALELSEQLADLNGILAEWNGFANSASGAGLYEDAVRYATIALEVKLNSDAPWLEARGMVLLNRANALMRLGRYAEAEADVSASLMSIPHPPNAAVRNQIVLAQYMFAELRLESGDLSAARTALEAASTWADACGVPKYKLQVDRVLARLSAFEFGVEHAASKLRELLEQAHGMDRSSLDDTVFDVLYALERVHREHGELDSANGWLNVIGERLRTNAIKLLEALEDKPLLADERSVAVKMKDVDTYLQSKAAARPEIVGVAPPSWTHLVGLAASASGVEDSTKEHGVRVARLAGLVARELGLSNAMQEGIEVGCLIHDVGKISVPSSILAKQTPLDDGEAQLFHAHPDIGAELLEHVKLAKQSVVLNVIRFHHHAYEGATAHSVANGEAIPLEARIASVCDRYDALVAGRPRKPAISSADALRELFEQRSRDFDPNLVDVVIDVVRRLQRTHPDVQAYLSEEADTMEYFAMQRTLKKAAERALAND